MLPSERDMTAVTSDEVLRRCRHAVAADPSNIKALLELGDVHHRRGEHHKALSAYERVVQRYVAAGALIKAVAVFKQMHWIIARYAPELASLYRHTQVQLAEALEALGLVDDAVAQYREAARQRLLDDDDVAAEHALLALARLAPNDTAGRMLLAELQMRRGDTAQAIVALEQVVTIALTSHATHEALSALERLSTLRSHPEDARLAAELLLDRNQVGDAQLALAKLQLCYRTNPRDLRTLRLLVTAFDTVGQPRRGDEVLKEAARIARDLEAHDTVSQIIRALELRSR